MRLQTVILFLAGVQRATAAAVEAQARQLTEADILQALRENPNVLPHHAQLMLKHKTEGLPMNLQKRSPQSGTLVALLGSLQNTLSSFGRPWPVSKVPEVQIIPSTRFPEAVRKRIRYGPYRIPPTSEQNLEYHLLQAKGMTNTLKFGAAKPCNKECLLLGLKASLEYADGSQIPSDTSGAWLHHVVLLNSGFAVQDATCGGMIENIFESGNEKSEIRFYFPESKVKSGYHIRNSDIFVINTELMNMEDKEKWAWLSLDYDYIEGFPDGWKEGKVVWLSVGPDRCTGSEWNPFGATNLTRTQQPIRDIFEEYSVPWKAPKDGLLLGSNSHLHDGGIDTKVFLGDRSICTSVAHYSKDAPPGMSGGMLGGSPGGMSGGTATGMSGGMGSHGHRKRQMGPSQFAEHISGQGECIFNDAIPIKKDESMFIKSTYDFTKHSGMRNARGELDEVMAIAGTLIAFDYKDWQSQRPGSSWFS